MYKYIVFWVLMRQVPTGCPNANMKDEFGRGGSMYSVCAVNHVRIDKENHSKEFSSRELAFDFYKRIKKEDKGNTMFTMESIGEIKIDSVKTNN